MNSNISRLLFRAGPSAICQLIVSIAIYSINGELWCWFSPHILKEVFKAKPSLANFYSLASVQVPFPMWFGASVYHANPRPPFRGRWAGFSVRKPTGFLYATTASRIARTETACGGRAQIAAVANGKPQHLVSITESDWPLGHKLTESLACYINRFHVQHYNSVKVCGGEA